MNNEELVGLIIKEASGFFAENASKIKNQLIESDSFYDDESLKPIVINKFFRDFRDNYVLSNKEFSYNIAIKSIMDVSFDEFSSEFLRFLPKKINSKKRFFKAVSKNNMYDLDKFVWICSKYIASKI